MKADSEIVTLCRDWRIIDAQLRADVLKAGDDDETVNSLTSEAMSKQEEIVDKLLETDPSTIMDALALMKVLAVAIDEACAIDPDHRQLFKLAMKAVAVAA